MAKFFKSWEILPSPNGAEEANWDMFNAPTVVYLTLPKGHTKYSVLDLGGK